MCIIDGKLYDTDTAEKVTTFQKRLPAFGDLVSINKPAKLYKTLNGRWFSTVAGRAPDEVWFFEETEGTAKNILTDLTAVEAYNKFIGKLEEA